MSGLGNVTVTASPKEKFREYLATQKMRLTPEREIIVDEVFDNHEHFDAEELSERLRASGRKRVSRSTVYRTLESMESAGLIRKVARPNGSEIWEHDYGYPQHDHLICRKCGELQEFHNDEIKAILETVADKMGFFMDGHRLEVFGLCSNCRRAPVRRHRKLDMI
ncbi:Fur family transcriptional regulator [Rubinisphaera margarita]|uniref:Fur family transcriptional regulator n=1 Tax=Rubinisphaera margarita TaxID=2909586 RepID=UPI001EE9019A|nr:Fur family transcriptional regulator [Rubinisphaera margarita]MCG6154212.1 transcriptional repressor [Rubinisphaera margarita]